MRHQRHRSAGVIVFRREGTECKVLLVLSRLTKRPLWEFPKGGVDEGETVLQAALRELFEETGLTEADIRMVPDFQRTEDYRFTSGRTDNRSMIHKQVTYFLAQTDKAEVVLSAEESSEYAWLGLADAAKRLRYKERRRLLQDAAVAVGCLPEANQPEMTSRSRQASKGSESARA
jgi:bis(5'-nucleosidyl)-tetraphosphatase